MKNKALTIVLCVLLCVIGVVVGFAGVTAISLPYNEELDLNDNADVYYSPSLTSKTVSASGVQEAKAGAVSVHFLELGNKYTGDSTYIKVGENIDILIDCGSKSDSIATVSSYLNNYVTDGILEYVIVTHGHQDHYAGFATTTKTASIFDLYECKNIITFTGCNQKSTSEYSQSVIDSIYGKGALHSYNAGKATYAGLYDNFLRELKAEKDNGAKVYSSKSFRETFENGKIVLDEENQISLQILNNYYDDEENQATTENDYSVCTLITQGEKKFLFTGDLEKKGEEELVSRNSLSQVDLFKAGHHGSKTSSNDALLKVIQPKIVCVCCCAGSPEYTKTEKNQFPTVDFIERISQYTDKVYLTSLCEENSYNSNTVQSFNGNIVVMAENKNSEIELYCSNNSTTLKDTEWFDTYRRNICTNLPASWDKSVS